MKKQVIFVTLVANSYPQNSAIRLLSDVEEETFKIPDFEKRDLHNMMHEQTITNMNNYTKDHNYNDKFHDLEQNIEIIDNVMAENIKKATHNKEELDSIDKRAAEMSYVADRYKSTSMQVRRNMFWEKYSVFFIIGFILLALITIGVVIFINEDNTSD